MKVLFQQLDPLKLCKAAGQQGVSTREREGERERESEVQIVTMIELEEEIFNTLSCFVPTTKKKRKKKKRTQQDY